MSAVGCFHVWHLCFPHPQPSKSRLRLSIWNGLYERVTTGPFMRRRSCRTELTLCWFVKPRGTYVVFLPRSLVMPADATVSTWWSLVPPAVWAIFWRDARASMCGFSARRERLNTKLLAPGKRPLHSKIPNADQISAIERFNANYDQISGFRVADQPATWRLDQAGFPFAARLSNSRRPR